MLTVIKNEYEHVVDAFNIEPSNLLPAREMNFLYNDNEVQIYEKDKHEKEQLIYNGKIH